MSSVFVSAYLANVRPTFSLSAPAAFSFEEPVALSKSEISLADEISDSAISKPTLYDGLPEYFSKISSCCSTLQKNPLMNTIPSDMFAIEARPFGVSVADATWNSLLLDADVTAPLSLTTTSVSSSSAKNVNE